MTAVLVFLVSLPLAVYTLAGFFLLIDLPDRFRATVSLTLRLVLLTGFILLTPDHARLWIGLGFLVVIALHITTALFLRHALTTGRWPAERIE